MAENNPNPETANPQGETPDSEGLDAAILAFGGQPEDAQEGNQAEPDPEAEGDANTEADEAEPDDAEPADKLVEVEVGGKTYKVPAELEKGYLRQADYSRAMNEVSSEKKTYTERLAQVEAASEGAEKYAEALAEVRQIEAHIAQMEALDWSSIEANSSTEYARMAVRHMQLQQKLGVANTKAQGVGNEMKQARQQLLNAKYADMAKVLDKKLPDWRGKAGEALTAWASERGIARETLQGITDPFVILQLEEARKYGALQASKTAIKAKAQPAPQVTKPGVPRGPTTARADALKAHRKDGSIDSAAAAFAAL